MKKIDLGGDFKYFLFSPRNPGEMIQFDEHIFQMGWFNHQLETIRQGLIFFGGGNQHFLKRVLHNLDGLF